MNSDIRRWFLQPVKAQRYKLILPFLILAALLSAVLIYFTSLTVRQAEAQLAERQLILARLQFTGSFGQQEAFHLATLRTLRFTQGMAQAIVAEDQERLLELAFPVVVNQGVDWVIIADTEGRSLLQLRRRAEFGDYLTIMEPDAVNWTPIVDRAGRGERVADNDKFADIVTVEGGRTYLLTAASVLPTQNGAPVGVIVVGTDLAEFLQRAKQVLPADIAIYNEGGNLLVTSLAATDLPAEIIQLDAELRQQLQTGDLAGPSAASPRRRIRVEAVDYDFLFSPLPLSTQDPGHQGYFAIALAPEGGQSGGSAAQLTLLGVFAIALLLVLNVGYFVATRFAEPL